MIYANIITQLDTRRGIKYKIDEFCYLVKINGDMIYIEDDLCDLLSTSKRKAKNKDCYTFELPKNTLLEMVYEVLSKYCCKMLEKKDVWGVITQVQDILTKMSGENDFKDYLGKIKLYNHHLDEVFIERINHIITKNPNPENLLLRLKKKNYQIIKNQERFISILQTKIVILTKYFNNDKRTPYDDFIMVCDLIKEQLEKIPTKKQDLIQASITVSQMVEHCAVLVGDFKRHKSDFLKQLDSLNTINEYYGKQTNMKQFVPEHLVQELSSISGSYKSSISKMVKGSMSQAYQLAASKFPQLCRYSVSVMKEAEFFLNKFQAIGQEVESIIMST